MSLRHRTCLFAGLALLLTACATFRKPVVPMATVEISNAPESRCLVVLLPGVYSSAERFAREGFGEMASNAGLRARIVAADAHLGYFRNRSVVERVHLDVIAPARDAGYDEVWVVGTSLGGLGGLLYMREHPEDLSGVYAIAPFLGDGKVIEEIETAGGPSGWHPPDTVEDDDVGRKLWSWIVDGGVEASGVPLHLGWGIKDDFDKANRMLAGMLPPDRVYTVDGGHDWEAWRALWAQLLERAMPCSR